VNPTQPIQERLSQLVLERQQLRDRGASREELEANRSAIVEEQWRLSNVAIETYASHYQAKAFAAAFRFRRAGAGAPGRVGRFPFSAKRPF
jgi:hypothetical protein